MALPDARSFGPAVPSVRGEEPLLIGLIGPPGGGKTVSAIRLAMGMRRVRSGPVVLIDTERGRSKKYSPQAGSKPLPGELSFEFLRVDLTPPFRSHDFLAAIKAQLPLKPAAIIIDTLSDEHEGEGGYLEFHDEMVPKMGGNEWAAWAMPKAARKRLISGMLQIKVPLIFTFRAREKTQTDSSGKGKAKIVNIGWMPVAPLEIVHSLDLTCILPPKADGVPIWESEKIGEDFIVKLPAFLAPLIKTGALSEDTGEALARWAMGDAGKGTATPRSEGGAVSTVSGTPENAPAGDQERRAGILADLSDLLVKHLGQDKVARGAAVRDAFGMSGAEVVKLKTEDIAIGLATLRKTLEGLAAMRLAAEKYARDRGTSGSNGLPGELPPSTADTIDWPEKPAEEEQEPGADDEIDF